MALALERRASLRRLEDLVTTRRTQGRDNLDQFVVGNAAAVVHQFVSADGLRYHRVIVGRIIEVDGKPVIDTDLRYEDLPAAHEALSQVRKWVVDLWLKANPEWWKRLGFILGLIKPTLF